jgi:hypothetical protein
MLNITLDKNDQVVAKFTPNINDPHDLTLTEEPSLGDFNVLDQVIENLEDSKAQFRE